MFRHITSRPHVLYHQDTFNEDITELANHISGYCELDQVNAVEPSRTTGIVYLSRGGAVPATYLAHQLNIGKERIVAWPNIHTLLHVVDRILIVDDISDTGVTLEVVKETTKDYIRNMNLPVEVLVATLWMREGTRVVPEFRVRTIVGKAWVIFPWETCIRPVRPPLPLNWNLKLLGVV